MDLDKDIQPVDSRDEDVFPEYPNDAYPLVERPTTPADEEALEKLREKLLGPSEREAQREEAQEEAERKEKLRLELLAKQFIRTNHELSKESMRALAPYYAMVSAKPIGWLPVVLLEIDRIAPPNHIALIKDIRTTMINSRFNQPGNVTNLGVARDVANMLRDTYRVEQKG